MADIMPVAHTTMLNGTIDALTTSVIAIRVGSANLGERKWLYIHNASPIKVFIGSETAQGTDVTVNSIARKGIKMATDESLWLPVSEKITVYALALSDGTNNSARLRIAELS